MRRIVILALVISVPGSSSALQQSPIAVSDLAAYRLTAPVFTRFEHASRLVAGVALEDPALVSAPLFTREVSVLGDVEAMAAALETRVSGHPGLADALRTAGMSPREYTTFAIALIAARLAHGFMSAGHLRFVPPGVATDNVAFVGAHEAAIAAILKTLGVEDPIPAG